ncbi:hypothetical protein GH733_008201 [Mirounga leonina]|nr:hypothetical protein GH733_008201 [Mirounga leonina]
MMEAQGRVLSVQLEGCHGRGGGGGGSSGAQWAAPCHPEGAAHALLRGPPSLWGRTSVELAELGGGGTLTFQKSAGEGAGGRGGLRALCWLWAPTPHSTPAHRCREGLGLGGAHALRRWLSLRPAPPCAPARLLLPGPPPTPPPQQLEQHSQTLLRATGHPAQPRCALDSPCPAAPAPF